MTQPTELVLAILPAAAALPALRNAGKATGAWTLRAPRHDAHQDGKLAYTSSLDDLDRKD